MSISRDLTQDLQQAVVDVAGKGGSVSLTGGGSKAFYGRSCEAEPLDVSGHRGIINYEPKELVITARAGTPLAEIEAALAEQGQMLAFEPPYFGDTATLGGTVACGLSGPRRPHAGSARDFVLGCHIINGLGQALHFGGEVMKNVAGYDVSRLMCGAMGTLGLMLDISLKVLPRPAQEITLVQERSEADAIRLMNLWAGKPWPISAASYDGLKLHVRLCGSPKGVEAACGRIGGERLEESSRFWKGLREHQLGFFDTSVPLWRLSVAPETGPMGLQGKQFIDWGGAQRWLLSDARADELRTAAARAGGHALLFRGGDREGDVFHPLPEPVMGLHRTLKQAFDPKGVFNPGRLYREL
ncbi:MAG: glycolate oxidase subunit GlcE [Sedimenticola sp.]